MTPSLQTVMSDVRAALGKPGEPIGPKHGAAPRFELFNGANSICSQKTRAVMAHHGIPYVSHSMNMFTGQTYLPAYVRLRLIGCDRLGGPLVSEHTGSTSVAAGGCDPAVVPTLVDWHDDAVIVDSKRICLHLDLAAGSAAPLRPAHLASRIDAELDVIDNLPNYQMLTGLPPGEDRRPASRRSGSGGAFALSKVERCDRYMAECAGDADLVRGYAAKRAKEFDAARKLYDPEAMRTAYDNAEAACAALERKLAGHATRWMFDDAITLADLYWGIELMRMKNLGADSFWSDGRLPAVAAFAEQAEALPAIRAVVLEWPGAVF